MFCLLTGLGSWVPPTRRYQHPLLDRGAPARAPPVAGQGANTNGLASQPNLLCVLMMDLLELGRFFSTFFLFYFFLLFFCPPPSVIYNLKVVLMAELFTLNFGKGYWTLAGNSPTARKSCWNRVTLQANTWRERGIRNARGAVTTWTHTTAWRRSDTCKNRGLHCQAWICQMLIFASSFYCFLKCFYFSVCVVFNVAELFHYSALCPTDKLEFYWTLFSTSDIYKLRYRHDYVYH